MASLDNACSVHVCDALFATRNYIPKHVVGTRIAKEEPGSDCMDMAAYR